MNATHAHVTITDDGAGFDVSRLDGAEDGHFGLRFMRDRMQQIGGSMEIESKPGAGTVLRLGVPARNHGRATGARAAG